MSMDELTQEPPCPVLLKVDLVDLAWVIDSMLTAEVTLKKIGTAEAGNAHSHILAAIIRLRSMMRQSNLAPSAN